MGQKCTICGHPRRSEVELATARRVGIRQIAQKFGVSQWAVQRHKAHMPPQLHAALAATGFPTCIDLDALRKDESEGLLQTLVAQRGRLYRLLDAAEEVGDLKAASAIHGRIDANVNSVARLLGEITTHSTTTVNNLLVAPEYVALRAALVTALRPHPEARKAVARVLRGMEGAEPHITGIPTLERASV